jgi:hypothetical protein
MDFKNEFIIELMECILSGADELQVKHMLDKETQNLQLQQTGVMPCFSYGQIITDGVYDAKVIENTQIIHSTMVKYLHNNIFDNISGVGWKIK